MTFTIKEEIVNGYAIEISVEKFETVPCVRVCPSRGVEFGYPVFERYYENMEKAEKAFKRQVKKYREETP